MALLFSVVQDSCCQVGVRKMDREETNWFPVNRTASKAMSASGFSFLISLKTVIHQCLKAILQIWSLIDEVRFPPTKFGGDVENIQIYQLGNTPLYNTSFLSISVMSSIHFEVRNLIKNCCYGNIVQSEATSHRQTLIYITHVH